MLILLSLHLTSAFAVALKPSLVLSAWSGFRGGKQASATLVVREWCKRWTLQCEVVCLWAGLAVGLVFPAPKQQKDFYKMVQPKQASGKLLNAQSPVSGLLLLTFPLAFKIKQIQECKTNPLWGNEWNETKSKQQELARGPHNCGASTPLLHGDQAEGLERDPCLWVPCLCWAE